MKKVAFPYLLLLLISGISQKVFSQQIYRIIRGDIIITMKYKDSVLEAKSNQLIETIDYETSQITFTVPYETLYTGIDSIDHQLRALKHMELKFIGKMDLTVNTLNSSLQKFNIEGTMISATPPTAAFGKGDLICYNAGHNGVTPSCMLTLTMKTTLTVLNLKQIFIYAHNDIQIDIRQSLLTKEKTN